MPWFPNGDYYQFDEPSISARAPAASGIYGLYNFRHQILIGATNNIRATLLQLKAEKRFRLQRLQPTGFTFERCAPELREPRARVLITEYQPILNDSSAASMTSLWRSFNYQGASAFHPPPPKANSRKLLPPPVEHPALPPRVLAPRPNWMAWVGSAAIIALVGGVYFGWRAWATTTRGSPVPQKIAVTERLDARRNGSGPARQSQSSEAAVQPTQPTATTAQTAPKDQGTPEQPPVLVEVATDNRNAREIPTERAGRSKQAPENRSAPAHAALGSQGRNHWTVQVRATADRSDATRVVDRLKARGYDAFLSEAAIKGRTLFRVRVGNFSTQPQAEIEQKRLQAQEGFRDAFIVNKATEPVVLARTDDENTSVSP